VAASEARREQPFACGDGFSRVPVGVHSDGWYLAIGNLEFRALSPDDRSTQALGSISQFIDNFDFIQLFGGDQRWGFRELDL